MSAHTAIGSPSPAAWARVRLACAALIALALAPMLVAGCGGSKSDSSSGSSSTASTPPPATRPAAAPAESAGGTPAAPAGTATASPDLGPQVFAKRCALCHGATGHGDGVGAKGLKPQPRNFHDLAYMKTRTDAELLATIHQGKGPMPRWQGVLSAAEMTAVLRYIRELGKKP